MAQVISDFIWYPDGYPGSAYDLRKVVSWGEGDSAAQVKVRFIGDPVAVRQFVLADFEAAMQNSLDNGG